eukprot:UN03183
MTNGFAPDEPTEYIVTPSISRKYGNMPLRCGDMVGYRESYHGLHGLIIGLTKDEKKMALININFSNEKFVLEHYLERDMANHMIHETWIMHQKKKRDEALKDK